MLRATGTQQMVLFATSIAYSVFYVRYNPCRLFNVLCFSMYLQRVVFPVKKNKETFAPPPDEMQCKAESRGSCTHALRMLVGLFSVPLNRAPVASLDFAT